MTVTPGVKVKPGLSSFVGNVEALYGYMHPLLMSALQAMPEGCTALPQLHVRGTAGMRLLDEDDQAFIWNGLFAQLTSHVSTLFELRRENFGTISGTNDS